MIGLDVRCCRYRKAAIYRALKNWRTVDRTRNAWPQCHRSSGTRTLHLLMIIYWNYFEIALKYLEQTKCMRSSLLGYWKQNGSLAYSQASFKERLKASCRSVDWRRKATPISSTFTKGKRKSTSQFNINMTFSETSSRSWATVTYALWYRMILYDALQIKPYLSKNA